MGNGSFLFSPENGGTGTKIKLKDQLGLRSRDIVVVSMPIIYGQWSFAL